MGSTHWDFLMLPRCSQDWELCATNLNLHINNQVVLLKCTLWFGPSWLGLRTFISNQPQDIPDGAGFIASDQHVTRSIQEKDSRLWWHMDIAERTYALNRDWNYISAFQLLCNSCNLPPPICKPSKAELSHRGRVGNPEPCPLGFLPPPHSTWSSPWSSLEDTLDTTF